MSSNIFLFSSPILFETGLALQNHFKSLTGNSILLVSHPSIYTSGRRSSLLPALPYPHFNTNRGGLSTFHGPGQLVVYPIVNLKSSNLTVRSFVQLLETTIIHSLAKLDIKATSKCDTGVWINDDKIAAIGISVTKSITSHGFAVNCNTDLKMFDYIVPCGLKGKGVTSITNQLKRNVSIEEYLPYLLESFQQLEGWNVKDIKQVDVKDFLQC